MQNYLNKKTIIIGIVVIVLIIGGSVFFFGRKSPLNIIGVISPDQFPVSGNKNPISGETPSNNSQQIPDASIQIADNSALNPDSIERFPTGTLFKLTDDSISSLTTATSGLVRFHKNIPDALGHLFEKKADGTTDEKRISNFTIPQVMKVVWAPGGTYAVVFYNLNGSIKKVMIDYSSSSTPKTSFLPDSVSDVAFSPDGKSMAFINDLGETRNIFTATADFKNQKKILNNILPDLEISWPGKTLLALKTKSSYAAVGYLYSLSSTGSVFNKIAEGLGIDAVWATDGSAVLVSTVNGLGQIQPLKYINIKTSEEKVINLNTFAEKCVFSNIVKEYFYCGAPAFGPKAKYPDAWWQGIVSFEDDIYGIYAVDGTVTAFTKSVLDVVHLKILKDDSFLIFKDKTTGFMWSMKLK